MSSLCITYFIYNGLIEVTKSYSSCHIWYTHTREEKTQKKKRRKNFFKAAQIYSCFPHCKHSAYFYHGNTHLFIFQSMHATYWSRVIHWTMCVWKSRAKWNNQLILPYTKCHLKHHNNNDRVNDWVCQKMHNISHLIIISCNLYKYLCSAHFVVVVVIVVMCRWTSKQCAIAKHCSVSSNLNLSYIVCHYRTWNEWCIFNAQEW